MTERFLTWPAQAAPRVLAAGRFPLADRAHEIVCTLRRDGVDERFADGDLVVSFRDQLTSYALDRPQRLWCIHFEPSPLTSTPVLIPVNVPLGAHRTYVVERMARIARLHTASVHDPVAAALASAIVLEVLLTMSQIATEQSTLPQYESDLKALAAAHWIEAHACDMLQIPRLARHVGLSQQYLARRFQTRFGMTMQRYQLACRIDQARQLLAHADIPIHRLARQLGFSDIQHFSKSFVRVVGMAPGRYRESRRPH